MTATPRGDRRTVNDRFDTVDEKLRTHDARFDQLDARAQVVEGDVRDLKEDVRVLKEDVAELKRDVAQLKVDVTQLKAAVGELRGALNDLRGEFEALRIEIRESVAENRRYFGVLMDRADEDRRLLAEGHAMLVRMFNDSRADVGRHEQGLDRHELRILRVEDHVGLPPLPEPGSTPTATRRRRRH